MQRSKKYINSHFLHLTLLVILLRLSPEQYFNNRWNEDFEVREIYLGASSAYTQHNYRNHRTETHGLIYRKSLDSMIIDDTLSVLEGLYYRQLENQFRQRQNNVLAFYVSSERTQDQHRTVQDDASNTLPPATPNLANTAHEGAEDEGSHSPEQASVVPQNHQGSLDLFLSRELSAEDLELIEILLKDDIEPGVPPDGGLDSFDLGKLTAISQKELLVHEDFNALNDFGSQASPLNNFWDTLDYPGSLERGPTSEHELSSEEEETKLVSSSYVDRSVDDIFNENHDNLYGSTAAASEHVNSSSNSLLPSPFPYLAENISIDEESMFAQLDQLEKCSTEEDIANNSAADETVSELYPNMEDCWQDITTTLPLPVIGSTHHGNSLSLLTRPSLTYSGVSSSNYPLSSSQASASENFSGVLLQNATLPQPTSDVSSTFSYIPTTLGPSSIGCAVAASMATLTNDTDPVPDGGSVTAYNSDFPELIYPNHTAVTSQGEYILSDLLLDEDFQLMDMATATEANYVTPANAVGEHLDTSSDSVVSLTSGRVPSISDCQEWVDSCSDSSHQGENDGSLMQMQNNFHYNQNPSNERSYSDDRASSQYPSSLHHTVAQKKYKLFGKKTSSNIEEAGTATGGHKPFTSDAQANKDYLYVPIKQPADELVNCSYGPVEGASAPPHEPNFGMPSLSSTGSFVPYPQHNHSYHLPFINSNCLDKPVTRDKANRASKCDDAELTNRDEKRARALKLPISIQDIINLAIDEFNERLSKYDLTEAQHTLIRDIRRRGKNKVAAQNCRKRKMDQINTLQQDLDQLQAERLQLETEQSQMLHQRKYYEDKYAKLYQYVVQATNSQTDSMNSVFPTCDVTLRSGASNLESDEGTNSNKGARTKKKLDKKSP